MDLDGTLLNSRREISKANRDALSEAAQRGAHIAVTTGRRYHSALPLLASLPCPATLIASNGALIATANNEIVRRKFLARDVARRALEAAPGFRPFAVAIYHIAGRGQLLLEQTASHEGPLAWYLANCAECVEQAPDLPSALPGDPTQILFGGPPARIEPLEAILSESDVSRDVHLTWTKYLTRNISLLDVLQRGCSKVEAVAWWAARQGIAAAEVMAIGDNYNDVEMLEFAGCPVLMGNSTPGLESSRWRQTLANDEDGVAAAVRQFVLKGF